MDWIHFDLSKDGFKAYFRKGSKCDGSNEKHDKAAWFFGI